ncbi:hypothetical protein BAY59_34500 [Prauserella coralliicola]|nr:MULTISPECIES: hypothetical protein [Pseudonocardiaceae]PXY18342.1 hypothetical protein BAY59_34500 [Prauserella coralliicola]
MTAAILGIGSRCKSSKPRWIALTNLGNNESSSPRNILMSAPAMNLDRVLVITTAPTSPRRTSEVAARLSWSTSCRSSALAGGRSTVRTATARSTLTRT